LRFYIGFIYAVYASAVAVTIFSSNPIGLQMGTSLLAAGFVLQGALAIRSWLEKRTPLLAFMSVLFVGGGLLMLCFNLAHRLTR